MWRLGFFFHEMSFGLLSVFIPLYVVTIGGSLVHIGIMSAIALFLAIPSSFFWGYACDRTRHKEGSRGIVYSPFGFGQIKAK
jgi:MFS family permease